MIDYLPNPSPYFQLNFKFCERISSELKALGVIYSGSCTSYGYDIYFKVRSGGVLYKINYHRHQSTGTRVAMKVDTRTRHYVLIEAHNLVTAGKVKINGLILLSPHFWGKQKIELDTGNRMYTDFKFQEEKIASLEETLKHLNIIRLTKKRERLKASFRNDSLLPSEIIAKFDELIQNIAN